MMEDRKTQSWLLDQVREASRVRHYSIGTEYTYVAWMRRFVLFHDKRDPAQMGEPEVARFLTHLAVEERVAAAKQNQRSMLLYFSTCPLWTGPWRRSRASPGPNGSNVDAGLGHDGDRARILTMGLDFRRACFDEPTPEVPWRTPGHLRAAAITRAYEQNATHHPGGHS